MNNQEKIMNKIISSLIFASGTVFLMPMASACEPMSGDHSSTIIFEQMDSNKDGLISKKEFDAYQNKHFKEMDANHDGKVTIEEFEAAHTKMHADHCDEPHHGFAQHQGYDEKHSDSFISKRFEAADTNHDGALSREEAKSMPMVLEHFDELDTNKDGKVTEDEIKAMMEGHDAEPEQKKDDKVPEKK
jgi:Ca2+-binding EF-hand superfamily protein